MNPGMFAASMVMGTAIMSVVVGGLVASFLIYRLFRVPTDRQRMWRAFWAGFVLFMISTPILVQPSPDFVAPWWELAVRVLSIVLYGVAFYFGVKSYVPPKVQVR